MKRLLPLLAMTAMFSVSPVLAQEVSNESIPSAEEFVAQAPPAAAVSLSSERSERPRMDLSDSQLEQLRALKDKYFADNAQKKAQLSVLKHQLKSEMIKVDTNRSAVMSLQSQINSLQADLSNSRVSMMLDAQQVFTPEQRKIMHSRALRGGLGHHKRGGGSCGGGQKHHFRGHGGPGGAGGPGFGPGRRAEGPDGPEGFEHAHADLPDAPDMDGIDS